MQCSQETPNHEKLRTQSTLISSVKKKISPKSRRECDQEIIVAAIKKALKSFENSKSPGNDGLPPEVYNAFNGILKTDLHKLYIEISQLGGMPQALSRQLCKLQQAVIFCLYLAAYINYDNKIYTKILANQIRPTLEDIIGPELTAAIKGRTIIENLRLNRDVMSYANAHKIQAAVIALDQEKALDRVDLNFLFKALHHFGYGPEITQKIKTVYQNIKTQTKVNGHLSQAFLVARGLRQ